MLSVILALATQNQVPAELQDYLRKPDPSYRFDYKEVSGGPAEISLTSQTWHGYKWQHQILVKQPKKIEFKNTAILFITGDGPRKGDYTALNMLTEITGMPTAMLFNVPNQPILNMKEDDLIAYTFEQYLKTGDGSWPLLFPMAKSALRAMDAVQEATKNSANPITQFVVTGASKRGWTTWFVGASGDKRVKAIAPMVIDNLNILPQMKHQLESWGTYSVQIQDYTRRGLQAKMATPEGHKLAVMVDPYSYRSKIKVPTLIVKGANDPYWTVDALDQYWSDLKQAKWILNVPNAGHDLAGGFMAIESVGAFARSIAGEFMMPKLSWKMDEEKGNYSGRTIIVRASSQHPAFSKMMIWSAESDDLDFRPKKYHVISTVSVDQPGQSVKPVLKALIPSDKNVAVFVEYRYKVNGREFSLSSPTKVFRKR